MTQEDKELLLKDLCARLPYGVKIKLGDYVYQVCGYNSEKKPLPLKIWYYYRDNSKSLIDVYLEDYYPHLRPMSSMTDAEGEEYRHLLQGIWDKLKDWKCANLIDWLNAHHFDYRGLIEKGLALEAPEDMYDTSQKWTTIRSELKLNELNLL